MMFWKKRKQIHLDCFTSSATIASDNPIEKASNFIPNWWKSLPISYDINTEHGVECQLPTMKGCLGFMDLYATGVVVPLWSDLNFKVFDNRFAYQFASSYGKIENHSIQQYNTYKNFVHFKIIAPWLFKEKTGVKFLLKSCIWSMLEHAPKLSIVSGVMSFDINQACNVNGFASYQKQSYQYNLRAGMPLMHIIPLSDKEVVPHVHVLSEQEWEQLNMTTKPYKFLQWGIHRRKLKKDA
jgi:hypothetical protein